MRKKLRQVTDSIHGTIYLSEMESLLMSTPFFYRLNDIYQSSTVYLTYPSNRTKRYEHSLGTMEMASQMFFSAIANAAPEERNHFIQKGRESFCNILEGLSTARRVRDVGYLHMKLGVFFPPAVFGQARSGDGSRYDYATVRNYISKAVSDGQINDVALDHFMTCFFDTFSLQSKEGKGVDMHEAALFLFLYQCTLEAVRVAALFHDVGHPPYSHIIEDVLKELYRTCKDGSGVQGFDREKAVALVDTLGRYREEEKAEEPELLLPARQAGQRGRPQLHEQVGLKMLQLAVEQVFPEVLRRITDAPSECCTPQDREVCQEYKTALALYYVTVVEFTFAILLEKNDFFLSLHRLIDGPLDADRMDYIVRDARNSGTDWGTIPYKRIISSAKFTCPLRDRGRPDFFANTYPQKVTEDINDLLLTRYKIFARINLHHRSVKTAMLLQTAVKELALDYLRTPTRTKVEPICEKIEKLWEVLSDLEMDASTSEHKGLRVGQWNDSWLVSVLYDALIQLDDGSIRQKLVVEGPEGRKESYLRYVGDLLAEVLLNDQAYFSLFKRKSDIDRLISAAAAGAGLDQEKLDGLALQGYRRLAEAQAAKDSEDERRARVCLRRIQLLRQVMDGDMDLLDVAFPDAGGDSEAHIRKVLDDARERKEILGYLMQKNDTRSKLGVSQQAPDDEGIYLYYSCFSKPNRYDVEATLLPQLRAIRTNGVWLYAYAKLPSKGDNALQTMEGLRQEAAGEVGLMLSAAYQGIKAGKTGPSLTERAVEAVLGRDGAFSAAEIAASLGGGRDAEQAAGNVVKALGLSDCLRCRDGKYFVDIPFPILH